MQALRGHRRYLNCRSRAWCQLGAALGLCTAARLAFGASAFAGLGGQRRALHLPGARAAAAAGGAASGVQAPATDRAYLEDTHLLQLDGCELLDVADQPTDAPEGAVRLGVVLDRTIFHPQGGGQPTDTGILSAQGLPDLFVSFVGVQKGNGVIVHECVAEPAIAAQWVKSVGKSQVTCRVDKDRRLLHARLHSAGHLLDAAVQAAGIEGWVPAKGYHFEDGPYVEYVLDAESKARAQAEKASIVSALQSEAQRLIDTGGAVSCRTGTDGMRHIQIAGEECPCGGTHVKDVAQLERVEVKKIKFKKNTARVSYVLGDA